MSSKVANISDRREHTILAALENESLEISSERDKTEREIKRLAESGFRDEAWKLLVNYLQIKEPRTVKR